MVDFTNCSLRLRVPSLGQTSRPGCPLSSGKLSLGSGSERNIRRDFIGVKSDQ
jgi:hypothetical protein